MTRASLPAALLALAACGKGADTGYPFTDPTCDYPDGVEEPMALGATLAPYRWPIAIHRDGTETSLDLAHVPCASDPVIDWSPFDVLLFVSIPAW